jgi:hypothetical protein
VIELQTEHARLTAKLAEAQAKLNELAFISERLQIESRGPIGPPGPRGRDGRDGALGPRGERGAEGKKGKPAPVVAEWRVDAGTFVATPHMSDGSSGAPLHLMPLFQVFESATSAIADRDENAAEQELRDEIAREAQRVRDGLPARG